MRLPESNRIRIGPFPDVSDISGTEVGNSPILHRYLVAGARKAVGHKFKGLSYPLLVMLWVGLAYAFVQTGDPVLDSHDKLYSRVQESESLRFTGNAHDQGLGRDPCVDCGSGSPNRRPRGGSGGSGGRRNPDRYRCGWSIHGHGRSPHVKNEL